MAVFHVMLKIYVEFSWNFKWFVSPDNLAKVYSIFFNLDLRFRLPVHLLPIVLLHARNRTILWGGNIVPKSSPTNQFNRSLISLNHAKKKKMKNKIFFRGFMLSNEETWLALLSWESKNRCLLLTTLNVMAGFFLLFDVTIDISHGKFISGKSGHTHHAKLPHVKGSFTTVKVSRVTAPNVCKSKSWTRGPFIHFFYFHLRE